MLLVYFIISLALFFDFLNGFHDSANSIATVVTTRVLKPRQAVLMAATANFISAFVFSTAVAATISKGIVLPYAISSQTILAGLLAASVWNIITWYLGLPTSSSHALIGALIGSTLITTGSQGLVFSGIVKTIAFIFIAPFMGFGGAVVFTIVVLLIIKNKSSNKLKKTFCQITNFIIFCLQSRPRH